MSQASIQDSLRYSNCCLKSVLVLGHVNSFQADDCSFLAISRKSDAALDCEQLFGTFKISGVGTFAIENTGDCGFNDIIQVEDNVGHPTYDESILTTDETQLPIEVLS